MANQEILNQLELLLAQQLSSKLDLLQEMVNINSFTANPQGVNKLGDLTADAFARLGFTAERMQATDFLYGKHLVLTRPGQAKDHLPVSQDRVNLSPGYCLSNG